MLSRRQGTHPRNSREGNYPMNNETSSFPLSTLLLVGEIEEALELGLETNFYRIVEMAVAEPAIRGIMTKRIRATESISTNPDSLTTVAAYVLGLSHPTLSHYHAAHPRG